MAVQANMISSGPLTVDANGYHWPDVYQVTDLTGNTAGQRHYNAINAGGIPSYGNAHASIPFIRVAQKTAQFAEGAVTTADVTVLYRILQAHELPPDESQAPQITVGSTIQMKTTNRDINGKQLWLGHVFFIRATDPKTLKVGDTFRGGVVVEVNYYDPPSVDLNLYGDVLIDQTGEVEIAVPQATIQFSRREDADPRLKARAFVGTINRTPIWDDPAHYWLCTRITGTSQDGGFSYHVSYEFQRNTDSWDPTIVFIDGDTDKPVAFPEHDPERQRGIGIKEVQVMPDTEFRALGI